MALIYPDPAEAALHLRVKAKIRQMIAQRVGSIGADAAATDAQVRQSARGSMEDER
jgi:hypothetical protein